MGARSYKVGSIYREERTRTAKTQMGRHVQSRSRKIMVKTSKRQKKVERTRKIILIRTKVKLDYKNSKCVDRVYAVLAPLFGMTHQEEEMRLKEADSPVDIPGSRLHIHNVGQRDRNRNQSATRDKLPDSGVIHCSTQWANNYVTSSNTTTFTTPTSGKEHLTNNGSNFNNNITASFQQQQHRSSYSTSSEFLSESSPDDSLGDFEDGQQSSSSLDVSPQGDEYRCFSHEELSDSDSLSDDGNCRGPLTTTGGRGIVNPNYPGFQHLAHQLHPSDSDETEEEGDSRSNNNYNNNNNNNNNNNGDDDVDDSVESKIDSVNHLDSVENFQKAFYDKPKFNIPVEPELECCCGAVSEINAVVPDVEKDLNVNIPESENTVVEESVTEKIVINSEEHENSVESECKVLVNNMAAISLAGNNIGTPPVADPQQINTAKMSDAFLSGAKEDLLAKGAADDSTIRNKCDEVMRDLDAVNQCDNDCNALKSGGDSNRVIEEWEEKENKSVEKFSKEEQTTSEKEKDEDSVVPRKKEKMEINYSVKKSRSNSCSSNVELQPAPSPVQQPQQEQGGAVVRRREFGPRGGRDLVLANRRSVPAAARDKKRSSTEILGTYCKLPYTLNSIN
ncbi:hypothetical protein C0J52_24480 [Blattella germanica]|nr:hypothetical protein C0J52_24480 [Blattella germanica]